MNQEYDVIGSKGDTYKVSVNDGVWECTCKAFMYSKELPQSCKHIKQIVNGVSTPTIPKNQKQIH